MKTEWWYDNSFFEYGVSEDLELARLTVRDDATAEILTPDRTREFANETDASLWLGDEEYVPLPLLLEELAEQGAPVDPRLHAPTGDDPAVLRRQMIVSLKTGPRTVGARLASPSAVLDQRHAMPPVRPEAS